MCLEKERYHYSCISEREYWSVLKTFVIYLNRYKEGDGGIDKTWIAIDDDVKKELDSL